MRRGVKTRHSRTSTPLLPLAQTRTVDSRGHCLSLPAHWGRVSTRVDRAPWPQCSPRRRPRCHPRDGRAVDPPQDRPRPRQSGETVTTMTYRHGPDDSRLTALCRGRIPRSAPTDNPPTRIRCRSILVTLTKITEVTTKNAHFS